MQMANKQAKGRTDGLKQTPRTFRIDNDLLTGMEKQENKNRFVNDSIRQALKKPLN